jgi:DNA-binding GntR family transcriptional regulator
MLLDRYERYVYLAVSSAALWSRDAAAEHKAILDAALARDADQVVALTQTHIRRTADIVEHKCRERAVGMLGLLARTPRVDMPLESRARR